MLDFQTLVEQNRDQIVSFRRELHAHPELSGQEVRTARRIAEELDKLGIPYVVDEKRNVIGKLTGGKPGGRIAIRGDFDALPVQEETGLPFRSQTPGVMHACGHDGHAAGLLGAAIVLASLRDALCGTVYLCFQMGEEISEGADEIVSYLKQEGGVDCVIAAHLMPRFTDADFFTAIGPLMAGNLKWSITVRGKGGHGSTPWMAIDPIKPAAEILLRVTALPAMRTDPFQPLVVSPCVFQAGSAMNIIPETARLEGTIRFYQKEQVQAVPALMEEIATRIAASYGATAELSVSGSTMPVVNDPAITKKLIAMAERLGMRVQMIPPASGSDNFGSFTSAFPGVYFFGGDTRPDRPFIVNHNPKFDIDEQAMLNNAALMSAFAFAFFAEAQ